MNLEIDTVRLAEDLGVDSLRLGHIVGVPGKNLEDIARIAKSHGLKILGPYSDHPQAERNTFYFEIDGKLLGAQIPNQTTRVGELPRKPDSYKDGSRGIPLIIGAYPV